MCEFCGCGFVDNKGHRGKAHAVVTTLAMIPVVAVDARADRARVHLDAAFEDRASSSSDRQASHDSSPATVG